MEEISVSGCPYGEPDETAAAYLAGRLSAAAATALEEHWFSCPRCVRAMGTAVELRGALGSPPATAGVRGFLGRLVATAAILALTVAGVWRWAPWTLPPASSAAAPGSVVRGGTRAVELHVERRTDGSLGASWTAVPGCEIYRFRLFSPGGDLLLEREVAVPQLNLAAGEVPARTGPLVAKVEALDALRRRVAESRLLPLSAEPGS